MQAHKKSHTSKYVFVSLAKAKVAIFHELQNYSAIYFFIERTLIHKLNFTQAKIIISPPYFKHSTRFICLFV